MALALNNGPIAVIALTKTGADQPLHPDDRWTRGDESHDHRRGGSHLKPLSKPSLHPSDPSAVMTYYPSKSRKSAKAAKAAKRQAASCSAKSRALQNTASLPQPRR